MMTHGQRVWNSRWWVLALLALAANACDKSVENEEGVGLEASDPSDMKAVIEAARARTMASTSPAPLASRGAPGDEVGPLRPDAIVHVEPTDLSTDIGETEFQVIVNNYGHPVADDVMNRLANQAHLRTWPEGQEVRTENEIAFDPDPLTGDTTQRRARVYLRPAVDLQDRWYTITVDDLPSGLSWATRGELHDFGSGRTGVRFRTGSDPVVKWVQVCEEYETDEKIVMVETSERIRLADARSGQPAIPTVALERGSPAACEIAAPRREQALSASGTLGLDVHCSGALSMDELVTVTIEPGTMISLSELPLRDPSGGKMSYSFVPSETRQQGAGCWRLLL